MSQRKDIYQRSLSLPMSAWKMQPLLPTLVERDGGGGGGEEEANLDEEMEKVFAETAAVSDSKFSLANVQAQDLSPHSRRFSENDYSFHRKKSYPHMHAPLKALKEVKRKQRPSLTTPPTRALSQVGEEGRHDSPPDSVAGDPAGSPPPLPLQPPGSAAGSSPDESTADEFPPSDSTTEPLVSERASAFDSELISPDDRRVQFDIGKTATGSPETEETRSPEQTISEEEATRKRTSGDEADQRKRRRHHHHHRKTSLMEEPGWRKRSGVEAALSSQRRMSEAVLEETSSLHELDQDQLVSHRFDVPRGKRRFSLKPKDQRKESAQLSIVGKKSYDHSPHEVFVQLDELTGLGTEREWKETARWIKYEEDVEEGAERWGRPHVAPLSFHSLLNLRRCLETGVILLDLEERELPGVVYRVVETMAREELITEEDKPTVMRALLLRHRHVSDYDSKFRFHVRRNTASYTSLQNLNDDPRKVRGVPSASALDKVASSLHLSPPPTGGHTAIDMKEETYLSSSEDINRKAVKESILKRIPAGAEATTVLVGAVDFLQQPTIAFVRLAQGILIPSITEVTIPVRFMFILLGPSYADLDYHEIGRSISTLMANPDFHKLAYKAMARKELLSAINEFLDSSIVLPPGDWERQALLPFQEIRAKTEAIRRRQSRAASQAQVLAGQLTTAAGEALLATAGEGDGGGEKRPPNPLERTGRAWGGLINDLKRRYPHYKSDITDGLNGQCLAAAIFMYFAALSAAITFGGLMADKTDNLVGISETLISTALGGVAFALLSGQPLLVIGTTGPLLLFDESLYTFCRENGLGYLQIRVYIGLWLAVISLVVSYCEGSVFVKLFTRFTEEIFASLISLLYIVESIMKVCKIYVKHPLMTVEEYCELHNDSRRMSVLESLPGNSSRQLDSSTGGWESASNSTSGALLRELRSVVLGGEETPSQNVSYLPQGVNLSSDVSRGRTEASLGLSPANEPNTALFCTILALGTFLIAYYLRNFRNSKFLGRSARRALGDFGVPIAIVVMVLLDYVTPGTYTEKLSVPQGLSPSKPEVRGWIISPFSEISPWAGLAALIPAILVYILLFMETHISELIIDKKERKLKKGSGFHVDIVLICLMNMGCGLIGAPFICAATVRSVTHASALTVMSRTHAPGDKPHIIEVKEQRVSGLLVSSLVGLSVLMSGLLRQVPMAVLFGVFLYMGIASINGIQFFDRCRLFFMPVKHHPQAAYVRRVPTLKMYLFTMIQLSCLVILWAVKSSQISLTFPFFLMLMVPLRAQLSHIFSPLELRALDSDEPDEDFGEEEPDFYAEALLPG